MQGKNTHIMIIYEKLYEKYQRLLNENKLLRNEIESYKKQLELVMPKFNDVPQHRQKQTITS